MYVKRCSFSGEESVNLTDGENVKWISLNSLDHSVYYPPVMSDYFMSQTMYSSDDVYSSREERISSSSLSAASTATAGSFHIPQRNRDCCALPSRPYRPAATDPSTKLHRANSSALPSKLYDPSASDHTSKVHRASSTLPRKLDRPANKPSPISFCWGSNGSVRCVGCMPDDAYSSSNASHERVVWESHHVTLSRVPGYGFGIAVSGGRDNPHFANGDPSIAISDVLKAGPAEGKLQVNDCIVSANGIPLENVEYGRAVQVLRDSGHSVSLTVRRRVVLPPPQPHTLRLHLNRTKKKDDFGLVLGCKIYVREVLRAEKDGVQEGDVILKINNHNTEGLSIKDARKLIENTKEKLSLVVKRERKGTNTPDTPTNSKESASNYLENNSYPAQNLYVQPPTRHHHAEDKSNLAPRGRSRGPLLNDVSLSQLDRPATPPGHGRSRSGVDEPPRPPPPRPEDYYSSRRQLYEDDVANRSKLPMPDPRFISFLKDGSVGIRLTGGNESGIFVTAVQPGSPASLQGLQPGDKILKVNDMDMKGVTREEAVLFLLSLQDQIDLIVQHRNDEYEQVVQSQKGDNFHVKAHFNYDQPNKGEMSFRKGDVFRVVDTLYNGVVGSWQVFRIGRNNQDVQKGIIPNKARAEELATAQFNATKKELSASESRGSFFRRRRNSHRRSKSLSKDHWDDVVFSDSISKFPAYERVGLRHPGFVRPVVLFGPVADIARERMLKDFPDKFTSPLMDSTLEDVAKSQKCSGIVRLSAIRDIMDRGKHAVLDITPNVVDRLNYAQFYPIVIFLKADTKHVIKELRAGQPKGAHKSSKKLLEQCQKVEKMWGHTFSSTITLTSPESWYRKLRELVDKQQACPVWASETKPDEALTDDFLFPMTSRLSYASSPESDLDLSPEPRSSMSASRRTMIRSSSDPSIATQDDVPCYNAPPPYIPHESRVLAPDQQHDKYPMTPDQQQEKYPMAPPDRQPGPELPPRIDRTSKPPRAGLPPSRSAQERLFGKGGPPPAAPHSPPSPLEPPNYINATPHLRAVAAASSNSLERHNNAKTNSYDSMSSYDSFHNRFGPNAHDDLKVNLVNGPSTTTNGSNGSISGPSGPVRASHEQPRGGFDPSRAGFEAPRSDQRPGQDPRSNHDPYRYTRSTTTPHKHPPAPEYKYRSGDYSPSKPAPPPKSGLKPVPPPKPKNYRPPQQPPAGSEPWHNGPPNHADYVTKGQLQSQNEWAPQSPQWRSHPSSPPGTLHKEHHHAKSFSLASAIDNYSSHHNGTMSPGKYSDNDVKGDIEHRGNPPSMTRSANYYYDRNNDHHYSLNGHSSIGHNREVSGLDLTNREQRGSAFELYKKPHYMDHGQRALGAGSGVLSSARGVFTSEGGVLESRDTGVSLRVPPGAIPPGINQEIYFKVCQDENSHLPPLDSDRGETLLSPLVMCGPQGLKFSTPVELRLPHRAATDEHDWALALQAGSPTKWQKVMLDQQLVDSRASNCVSVMVDHF